MSEQLTPVEESNEHRPRVMYDGTHPSEIIAIEELNTYQRLQMKHDEIYHHEIVVLNVSQRMNHVVLHLIKYLNLLFSLPVSSSENRRALIDSFIMIVSASNLLGISLARSLLTKEVNRFNKEFIDEYIHLLSALAKACEAADHQEEYPIRATWNKNIQRFFHLLIREAASRNISILEEASRRLASVEMNHPLASILQESE